jgi:pentatricopeptide repeat domain-containing protein 1
MIKAYGHCGDLQTAFSLVDEMISASISIDGEVLSMLLQACISEKKAGLRFAIEV